CGPRPSAASAPPAMIPPRRQSASRRGMPRARDFASSSNEWFMGLTLCMTGRQGEDRLDADRHVGGEDPLLVNQVRDGGGEHAVKKRNLPLLLQHNGKGQAQLGYLCAVAFQVAPAHHQDFKV